MVTDFNQLYYKNSYQAEFTAEILEQRISGDGLWLRLSETCFYPEGGGQPGDRGLLKPEGSASCLRVIDTQESGGLIWHRIELAEEDGLAEKMTVSGQKVEARIDWERRFDLMQQHSAEHIYSGLVNKHFGWDNVGFHISESSMTIDFSGPMTADEITLIEDLTNEAITLNLPYHIHYLDPDRAAALTYRSKIELPNRIRLVEVPGYDVCACSGTQVRHTGELGLLKVIDAMAYKGGVRLELLAGRRALRDYRAKHEIIRSIGSELSSKPDHVREAVVRLSLKQEALEAELAQVRRKLLDMLTQSWPETLPEKTLIAAPGWDKENHKALAKLLSQRQSARGAVITEQDGGTVLFTLTAAEGLDAREELKSLQMMFAARGGGRPEFVSGQIAGQDDFPAAAALEAYLRDAGYTAYRV